MFTGLVEHVGTIESFERSDSGARIRVNAGPLANGLEKSGSIAVNGCCLTAIDISGNTFAADLSGETLRRTSLGELKLGARVNLERPLTAHEGTGRPLRAGPRRRRRPRRARSTLKAPTGGSACACPRNSPVTSP